jgi:methyl-accepting chemotaxis protein
MNPSNIRKSNVLTQRLNNLLALLAAGLSGVGALVLFTLTGSVFAAGSWVAVAIVTTLVCQRALWEGIAGPVRLTLEAVQKIAQGDFDVHLTPEELGYLSDYSETLNALCQSQQRITEQVSEVVGHLQEVPERIIEAIQEIEAGRESTEESVEETASLLVNINTSIRGINSEVESLSRATDEASSSILEMGGSIDEVARNAGSLHDSVDASTSSIHEISASIRQVAESADAVQSMAEESAAAMAQMDRAIQEVSQHVSEASGLTEAVSQGAQAGSQAVGATIDGIAEIRQQTLDAKEVLERLAGRIAEIGEIVNVIGGINDEANLLSLNAAIIAAQAGEQGKAFAVVANHVKTLAQRTTSSTQEIEGLIRAVQQESSNAVTAMAGGIEAVEKGVDRSRKAGEELENIRTSSGEASSRVAEIARATGEQSRNSKHVAEAAQRTSSMVQQISGAMSEQSRAGETMLKNAESALEMCRQVHRSTEEQKESGRFITASISSVTEMIRSIQQNTESHGAASEAVAEAVTRILEIAGKSGERIPEVVASLESLRAEARSLAGATASASPTASPSDGGA